MKIVVSDSAGRFVFDEADDPSPDPRALLVRVLATSLNPRDLRMARGRAGYRCGIDFVGVVERGAGRSGPQPGAQVAGVLAAGAWAELLAVSPSAVAAVPDGVGLHQAAAMPSAGLTALYALSTGGELIGRRVLVTAAAGAVGRMACQLARIAGAQVTASVRSTEKAVAMAQLADAVIGASPGEAEHRGPFDLIVESVGGESLAASAQLLAPGGICVVLGSTAGGGAAIDAADLYQNSRTLTGFALFRALDARPASDGLARLFGLAAEGRLSSQIGTVYPWGDVNEAASAMADGRATGKIILEMR